ncbi:hypothetical protein [Solimonas soli]|uniref:hypothetical protein n=1 Tax=Solimonas soli TaxID=413479 RepID=UPI0004851FE2|nr:hypothetical protein [Solimonas soli]
MNKDHARELKSHGIEIRTHRHRTGWTYRLAVDSAGTFDTDRTYITRQAAIEAATLRLIRELPALFEQDLIEQVPCQLRTS